MSEGGRGWEMASATHTNLLPTFTTPAQVPALQHLVQQRLNLPILALYKCDQGLSALVCIQQGGSAVPAAWTNSLWPLKHDMAAGAHAQAGPTHKIRCPSSGRAYSLT